MRRAGGRQRGGDQHAWLVGYLTGTRTLLQEWDGRGWREHQPPADCLRAGTSFGGMPTFCNLTSVTAFAPDDVWVAGNGAWPGFRGPLLFHWDGHSWQTVQVGINRQDHSFSAIGGTSASDLWAAAGPRGADLPTSPRTLTAIIMEYSNPATPTASTSPAGSPTPAGSTTPG